MQKLVTYPWLDNEAEERLDEMIRSEDKEAAKRAMEAMLDMKKIIIADLEKAFAGK
jgi:hypothetical protein